MGIQKSSIKQEQKTLQKLRQQFISKSKQLVDLKKQNQTLIKQVLPSDKLKKQYTIESLMHTNYAMFTCIICQNFFDEENRVPIMICKKQHTICQPCFEEKSKKNEKKCFQCDQAFKDYGKNRSVLNLIRNKQDLLSWTKERDAQLQQQIKQQNIGSQAQLPNRTMVHLCRFLNYQTMFELNGDTLLKISPQASWHTLRSMQNLPPFSQSEVSFKIISSLHNSLIVGITTQNQQFQKGFIPSNSVAYHLNNGHIYDEAAVNQFKWRKDGTPVLKNSNPRISMSINTLQKTINWKIYNKIHGQALIPQRFSTLPIYVFVAIFHKGDIIVLNK